MSTYRPLPNSVTIGNSAIHGLGLFAVETIAPGKFLGMIRILVEDEWIRTPLGGFVNHSEEPNCMTIQRRPLSSLAGYSVVNLIAVETILPGQEITLKYTMYNV